MGRVAMLAVFCQRAQQRPRLWALRDRCQRCEGGLVRCCGRWPGACSQMCHPLSLTEDGGLMVVVV
eukprot:4964353-Pleurochrysis_carterae.AAC.1